MSDLVVASRDGAVQRLTLNDDATRNSLSEGMMAALQSHFDSAETDTNIHVVVVASTGKAFSSGHNLKQLTDRRADADKGSSYFNQLFATCAKLMVTIARHRCAVIAEVDGLASAAGCQLVATCDLAFASPNAGFCTPGVNIGLFCSTPMVAVSRVAGSKHAMEMLLTGDTYPAEYAARIGLVNLVVPQPDLRNHVDGVAQRIAGKSGQAIAYGKRLFADQRHLELDDAYAFTSAVMARNMLDDSAREGIDAFIAKRQPQWPKVIV